MKYGDFSMKKAYTFYVSVVADPVLGLALQSYLDLIQIFRISNNVTYILVTRDTSHGMGEGDPSYRQMSHTKRIHGGISDF